MTTPSSKPVRVLLVDDHTMVRRGLATFLKSSMIWNWQAKPRTARLPFNCVPNCSPMWS